MCAFQHPVITTLNIRCRRPKVILIDQNASHLMCTNHMGTLLKSDSESVDLECSLRFCLSHKHPGEDAAAGLEIQPSRARLEAVLWVRPMFQWSFASSLGHLHQFCPPRLWVLSSTPLHPPRNLVSCVVCSSNQIPWLTDSWNGISFWNSPQP